MAQIETQIGKNGLSDGNIDWLKNAFKTHELVKVRVLKSSGRDRESIKELSGEILEKLGKNYTCKIVGFTLTLRKWRKNKR